MPVVLDWVGNSYFGHEALRRGSETPAFQRLVGAAGADTAGFSVLHGLLTPDRINRRMAESGVPLDEEQYQVLLAMNDGPDTLFCIFALAGTGQTAVTHCVLKAFMEAPARHGALSYTQCQRGPCGRRW